VDVKNLKNAMTVDVEDYFQVSAFDKKIKPADWNDYPYRVGDSTRRILDLFALKNVKATFFVLGWVARKDPELVKRIVSDGHELASHGFWHQKAFTQSSMDFLQDITESKALLEDVGGVEVKGYRAPSFSIDKRNEWAFDSLKEAGYVYSSSTYAIAHDHYGTPDWPTKPYRLENGLWEFPQATVEHLGRRLPVGGGGYFRLFPLGLSKFFIKSFHQQHNHPYIFYFHPWEIDVEQPRIDGISAKSRFRHYVNLSRMESKISALCDTFSWDSIENLYQINTLKGG
jgi:polysaccharide deacetylase family protein (PEP-CTERM system associated)